MDELKTKEGTFPLHTLVTLLESIVGRGLTATITLASAPTHPVILVSVTVIVTGVIALKSTLITLLAALAIVPPAVVVQV